MFKPFTLTRRGALLAAAGAGAGLAACSEEVRFDPLPLPDGPFKHGVASGDPDQTSLVVWTAVTAEGDARTTLDIATDETFNTIVETRELAPREGVIAVNGARPMKALIEGLEPGREYFYRFRHGGEVSPVGKTRTLPDGPVDRFRIAAFSCSNYPFGFFNAYRDAANEGFDLMVHLGDYIYEYGHGGYGTEDAERLSRVPDPMHETLSEEDYARRHALYCSDPDLQAAKAAAPWILIWDDHETANDSWRYGAENHDPETEGDWFTRRDNALRAYHDWLPVREAEPLKKRYGAVEIGDLATLVFLETRLTARSEELTLDSFPIDPTSDPEDPENRAAVQRWRDEVIGDPERRLLSDTQRQPYWEEVQANYARIRETRARTQGNRRRLTLAEARERAFDADATGHQPVKPLQPGLTTIDDGRLADLVPYIDWTPFFFSWEMKGTYPAIFDDPNRGEAARALFEDAQLMLKQMVDGDWLKPKGVVGLWPARREGDDIAVFADEACNSRLGKFYGLRQQAEKDGEKPYLSISDFVRSDVTDWVGGFAVTSGHAEDEIAERFKRANDDYSAIMFQALADRFAEAFAEYLHERVRKEIWGYASDERLSNEELIKEAYAGIRPAPGYPAQPDHTEKDLLFKLLEAPERTGMILTESRAMYPAASVSGLYLAHPDSVYFAVGRITRDQVEDYAQRKGWSVEEAEKALAPVLGYEPDAARLEEADAAA